MALTPHQGDALASLIEFVSSNQSLAVVEGFAGTGKTFLMGEFLRKMASKLPICVAAPTHKALEVICASLDAAGVPIGIAQADDNLSGGLFEVYARKQQEVGIQTATIHSLLALKLVELENGEAECRRDPNKQPSLSEYALVVIDESSLISRAMFELILTHKRTAKVLFIGDPAQLPPIDDKDAISPVFTHVDFKIRLGEIVRQAKDNPIIQLSMAIRSKVDKFNVNDFLGNLPPLPAAAACVSGDKSLLVSFAAAERLAGRDARVLCYKNQTVAEINRMTHDRLHPGTVFAPGETLLCYFSAGADGSKSPFTNSRGERVIVRLMDELTVASCDAQEDDPASLPCFKLTLITVLGDLLTTLVPQQPLAYQREISAVWAKYRKINSDYTFEKDVDQKNALKLEKSKLSRKAYAMRDKYPDLRHAYAMTVHRSQGSTFDTALVHYQDMNTMKSAFEFNRALYVACTRASQYLAVVV